jgi:PAS domain S-box-containing protein
VYAWTADAVSMTELAGTAERRRDIVRAAAQRLQRYVLLGIGVVMMLNGVGSTLITLLDPNLQLDLLIGFLPDAVVGPAVIWLVVVRRTPRPAVIALAWYFGLTYTFYAFNAASLVVFVSPWALLPILFAAYAGTQRLRRIMIGVMVADAAIALCVGIAGIGLSLMTMPSFAEPGGMALSGAGNVIVLLLFIVAEGSRRRNQRELEVALATLDEQERRLETLVENTDDAILMLDADGKILTANRSADVVTQCDGSLPGRPFLDVVDPSRRPAWRQRLDECATIGRIRIEEVIGTDQFEISVRAIPSPTGATGFTLFARNISERREAELALQRLRGQLLEASRLAGRAEIAAGVLHNVGNVLTSVSLSAEQVREIAGDLRIPTFRKAIEVLRQDDPARREKAVSLLDALLQHLDEARARLVGESQSLRERLEHIRKVLRSQQQYARAREVIEEVDVGELIRSAVPLDDGWRDSGIQLQCEVPERLAPLVCDRHKLLQILVNLLRNARDAVREQAPIEPRVIVRARGGDEGGLVIEVEDNGIGIAQENRARMFAHGFTTKPDGHGFGLHSAALLAAELGGSLHFASAGVGEGCMFTLALPAASRSAAA